MLAFIAFTALGGAIADDSHTIVGRVRNEAGAPVAGAAVFLPTSAPPDHAVVAQTRSGADGTFRLVCPAAQARHVQGLLTLADGYAMAVTNFNNLATQQDGTPANQGWIVTLSRAEVDKDAAAFQVLDPAGKPVADAAIEAKAMATEGGMSTTIYVPSSVVERLRGRTDAAGWVHLGVPRKSIAMLAASTAAFGRQTIYTNVGADWTNVRLRAAGSVVGRISAPAGVSLGDVSVHLESTTPPTPGALYVQGLSNIRPDAAGRFETPLAAGAVAAHLTLPENYPLRALWVNDLKLTPAGKVEVAFALTPAVRVFGEIKDADGRPASGQIFLFSSANPAGGFGVAAGASGRFQFFALPGDYILGVTPPAGYVSVRGPWFFRVRTTISIPADAKERNLGIVRVERARGLEGVVVDEEKKPSPGAVIQGRWTVTQMLSGGVAIADKDGRFSLQIPQGAASIELDCRDAGAMQYSAAPRLVRFPADGATTLAVAARNGVFLVGQVKDSSGKPLSSIAVEVERRFDGKYFTDGFAIRFGDGASLTTDAAGRFSSPTRLPRAGEYRVLVCAPGYARRTTGWFKPPAEPATEVSAPSIVLPRFADVFGRVVDAAGKPVASAEVVVIAGLGSKHSVTDKDGAFRVTDLDGADAVVVAHAPGFSYTGRRIAVGAAAEILLPRPGVGSLRFALPPSLRPEEEKRIALSTLAPLVRIAFEKHDESLLQAIAGPLCSLDPIEAQRRIDSDRKLGSNERDFGRMSLARVLARADVDVDDALPVIESMSEGYVKAFAYLTIVRGLSGEAKSRAKELLAHALVQARAVADPGQRTVLLGMLGEQLLHAGARADAVLVLREAESSAKKLLNLSWVGYAKGALAESLSLIDSPAAFRLVEGLGDAAERDRHYAGIAHKLAALDADACQRAIFLIKDASQKNHATLRASFRMAAVDLPRARALAENISEPIMRAYAYGVMASNAGIPSADRARLLEEAFATLEKHRGLSIWSAAAEGDVGYVAAAMLPIVEKVAPRRLDEYFWRSLRLHQDFQKTGFDPSTEIEPQLKHGAALAVQLGRYDRSIGALLLSPVLDRFKLMTAGASNQQYTSAEAVFTAVALLAPEKLPELLALSPPSSDAKFRSLCIESRLAAARALASPLDKRPYLYHYRMLYLWTPDREELDEMTGD